MNVELKSVKFMEGHEGLAYRGNLFVNGKKVGDVHDDGNGGEVCIWIDPSKKELEKELRAWAKSLPDTLTDYKHGGKPFAIKSDLEWVVSELFEDHIVKKENAKLVRKSKTHILWGNKHHYTSAGWKGVTLLTLAVTPKGLETIQKNVDRIKAKCKDDETILHPEHLISLGVVL